MQVLYLVTYRILNLCEYCIVLNVFVRRLFSITYLLKSNEVLTLNDD